MPKQKGAELNKFSAFFNITLQHLYSYGEAD
jgi:hypothetical protein